MGVVCASFSFSSSSSLVDEEPFKPLVLKPYLPLVDSLEALVSEEELNELLRMVIPRERVKS